MGSGTLACGDTCRFFLTGGCGAGAVNCAEECAGPQYTVCTCSSADCGVEPTPRACVQGTISECTDANESWEAAECCVSGVLGYSGCAYGSAVACQDPGEHWTGQKCCVEGADDCMSGTQSSCDTIGGSWTGEECCFYRGEDICTGGTAGSCAGSTSAGQERSAVSTPPIATR